MSSFNREVITLQVGHFSNFIGTHWWNLQEASFVYDETIKTEINHNTLFRSGCLPNKEITFTPRLVAVDFKGSLGSLPILGTLYDNPTPLISQAQWDGKVRLIQQLTPHKNRFLQALEEEDNLYQHEAKSTNKMSVDDLRNASLQDEINVWSDFLRPHLHPNSVFTFQDAWHNDDAKDDVWGFQEGVSVMKKQIMQDEIEEKIRFQAESCDSLQGFHVLCDGHDGMGGIACKMVEHLQDEYSPKEVFSFVSIPPHFKPSSRSSVDMYLTSLLQCYSELFKFSTIVTPLNLRKHSWQPWSEAVTWPHINYNPASAYETSSIFSSFIETVTTSYRIKENPLRMMHLSEMLTPMQKKFVIGRLMLPFGMAEDDFLMDWLQREEPNLDGISISGECSTSKALCSVSILKGINPNHLKGKMSNTHAKFATPSQLLQILMSKGGNSNHFHNIIVSDALTTAVPYPHIFKDNVTTHGFINNDYKRNGSVAKVSSMASLNQSEDIELNLKQMLKGVHKLDVNKLPKLIEAGMDREMWKEVVDEFRCLIENYGSVQE